MSERLTDCEVCRGAGNVGPVHVNMGDDPHYWLESIPCIECGGTGLWSPERKAAWERGRAMRQARIGRRESLAASADRIGITAAELSSIERGREPATDAGRRAIQGDSE